MKMKKIQEKILVCIVLLCVTCMFAVIPVSAGNGPNPHPLDSQAWIMIKDVSSGKLTYLYSAPEPDCVSVVAGMSYDQAANTLTLSAFNNPAVGIITNEMGDDFTIKVTGTSRIQQILAWGFGYGGSVTLTGTGELVINENKQEDIPIYLMAEGAGAKLTVASGLSLKAYSQTGYPAAVVNGSSAAADGIVFEGNHLLNQKVVKTQNQTLAMYDTVYPTDSTRQLTSCTAKNEADTARYGASKCIDTDTFEEYYEIYRVIEDKDLGLVGEPAVDEYGNPLSPDDFNITESDYFDVINTTFGMSLYQYTSTKDSAAYGCFSSHYYENDEDLGVLHSMYRIVEKDDENFHCLFGVPVENEQKISEIPKWYVPVQGAIFYSYAYKEEMIQIQGAAGASCTGGHTPQTITTKATPASDGKIVTTCAVCHQTLSASVIDGVSDIRLSDTSYPYNGKTRKPSVIVKDRKGKSLKENVDYQVSYPQESRDVGQYTVTVQLIGNYSGIKSLSFTVSPETTKLLSVKPKKKAVVVKWKKQGNEINGYQIQYATDKNFRKNVKAVNVTKSKTGSRTITKLKAKKKYYVRIRTYKTVKTGGKKTKLYSAWSKAKSVTVK